MFKTAKTTVKHFSLTVRLSRFGVDVVASRTSLAGVSRVNPNDFDSGNTGFVFGEQSQLIESPPIDFCSGFPSNFRSQPNARQIFKSNCRIQFLSNFNELLADVVVDPFLKSRFSPGEPSEQPFGRLSAFGLNRSANLDKSVSDLPQLRSIPRLSRRCGCNISQSQINSQNFRGFPFGLSRNLNDNIDIIVAIYALRKCGTGGRLTPKQGDLIAANFQVKIHTSRLQCYAYFLLGFNIFERPSIKTDASGSKLVNLFSGFALVHHAANCLTDVIGFQSRCLSNPLVSQVMQFGGVPTVVVFSCLQYAVTSVGKTRQSLVDPFGKLGWDYQLAFYRDCLIHPPMVTHLGDNVHNMERHSSQRQRANTYGVGLRPKFR